MLSMFVSKMASFLHFRLSFFLILVVNCILSCSASFDDIFPSHKHQNLRKLNGNWIHDSGADSAKFSRILGSRLTDSSSRNPDDVVSNVNVGRYNEWQILKRNIQVGTVNLNGHRLPKEGSRTNDKNKNIDNKNVDNWNLKMSTEFIPGQQAMPFSVETTMGALVFPSPELLNKSIIFHTFDNRSAFLECLWTSSSSLEAISSSPESVHYIFMSTSEHAKQDALWMEHQLNSSIQSMMWNGKLSRKVGNSLQARFHFVTLPTYQLGNWLPAILMDWACQDHGCGFTQVFFKSVTGSTYEIVLKRLDARYDWLPLPSQAFSSSQSVILAGNGCSLRNDVAGHIALVIDGDCSFAEKVWFMEESQAVGVIVYSKPGQPVQDMNCEGTECDTQLNIPATMIPYSQQLIESVQNDSMNVSFQTTPSENFYFAIDAQGRLAELGWLLYPSFQFFVWQAQWFDYKSDLLKNLSQDATVISVINNTIMEGHTGVVETVTIPSLIDVSKIELDVSLSCPGDRDETCPPWDHTVQLFVCCDQTSPLCGMELGRWITSFRRRIGRWLTDVSALAPLFTSTKCTFTMKNTAWWAQPWKPSLNIRFHKSDSLKASPHQIVPLFRGGIFNQTYNTKYKPINFTLPQGTQKVVLYAVITGHGSDNNGCGEFCVTSHHFIVNKHPNVKTFNNAGTPIGCAERTPTGVEPNEHGTWLYGRDGWCDGREVDPWIVDVTSQLNMQSVNTIQYFGWFSGKDPNPSENPGSIIMYSYLVIYQ